MATPILTIDSLTTRDIDDAFSIERTATGYTLTVMIADPTGAVPVGEDLDHSAKTKVATVYRREAAVMKMLPAEISERGSSLVQGRKRDAMVLRMTLDEGLQRTSTVVSFERIKVTARLSHPDIPGILADRSHALHESVCLAAELAQHLLNNRRGAGALALYDLQQLLLTDEEGQVRSFSSKEEVMGHIIVQEMMIMANVTLADYFLANNIPGIFRNHVPKVSAPSSSELAETLNGWLKQGEIPYQASAKKILATVGSASYESCVKGHYGLAIHAYLHLTSPLRRYVDLVNMRLLKAFHLNDVLPYNVAGLSDLAMHINTTLAEREAERIDHFKSAVKAKAESQMAADKLYGAPEEILVQAIKLVASSGQMPPSLETELLRLFTCNAMTDKIVDALMVKLPAGAWPECLSKAYLGWLQAVPSRAMHALSHGEQSAAFTYKFTTTATAGGFVSSCRLRKDGHQWVREAQGGRKRDAEQAAAAAALGAMIALASEMTPQVGEAGQEVPSNDQSTVDVQLAEVPSTVLTPNAKGMLISMCQAMKCSAPEYETHSEGPGHCLTFTCSAGIQIGHDRITETANASSKKEAEAKVSQALLIKLAATKDRADVAQSTKPFVLVAAHDSSSNYKGTLMELCQKNRWAAPSFHSLAVGPSHQPLFNTTVEVEINGSRHKGEGVGGSKKAAEAQACQMLLTTLRNGC